MNKVASFQVVDSFQLTGRGLVAIGDILDGKVHVGDSTDLIIDGLKCKLQITGVSIGNPDNTGKFFVGLHLSGGSPMDLTKVKLQPQVINVCAIVNHE